MPSNDGLVAFSEESASAMEMDADADSAPGWCAEAPENVPALANVFTLLSDETRLRIVFELVLRRSECPANPTLSFSALRSRVGARDAGRFNYHLGRLRDDLVEKVEDGYRLTPTGEAVGLTLVASALGRLDAKHGTPT
ncbi:MAG TPA: winged helix-turn-helix domain-containing protein [Natrialbaceae archaeon]|nr:winged helix-turn-helix domain-containing protein [Natrialbaceae archaeon]